MPVWNTANNIKRGSSQVIKMLRGGNSPWAAYNAATGGTVTTVSNYNGTGETWKVHRFTSNGTLTVTSAPGAFPFRVLLVGAGNGGRRGASGGRLVDTTSAIPAGSHAITIAPAVGHESYGGDSSIGSVISSSGGNVKGAATRGWDVNITGTAQVLAGGGGTSSFGSNTPAPAGGGGNVGQNGQANTGGGGGTSPTDGGNWVVGNGGGGGSGVVVVAYRVA